MLNLVLHALQCKKYILKDQNQTRNHHIFSVKCGSNFFNSNGERRPKWRLDHLQIVLSIHRFGRKTPQHLRIITNTSRKFPSAVKVWAEENTPPNEPNPRRLAHCAQHLNTLRITGTRYVNLTLPALMASTNSVDKDQNSGFRFLRRRLVCFRVRDSALLPPEDENWGTKRAGRRESVRNNHQNNSSDRVLLLTKVNQQILRRSSEWVSISVEILHCAVVYRAHNFPADAGASDLYQRLVLTEVVNVDIFWQCSTHSSFPFCLFWQKGGIFLHNINTERQPVETLLEFTRSSFTN